jgi:hypothetical protein
MVGNVLNNGNAYVATGSYTSNWNFASRVGTFGFNFDGTNYAGLGRAPRTDPANFTGGMVGGTLANPRVGAFNGSFFSSPTQAAQYQGGSFGILGANYQASGIFAGQRR